MPNSPFPTKPESYSTDFEKAKKAFGGYRANDPIGLSAGAGLDWLQEAWRLFKESPGQWVLFSLAFLAIFAFLSVIPVIGGFVALLVLPFLIGGMYRTMEDQVSCKQLSIGRLFSCFNDENIRTRLLKIGVASILMSMLLTLILFFTVFSTFSGVLSASKGENAIFSVSLSLLFAAIFILLIIQISAISWYGSMLVLTTNLRTWGIVKSTFRAFLVNVLPMFVYSLLMSVLLIVSLIPFGLGLFITMPLLYLSTYTSFKAMWPEAVSPQSTS